MANKKRLRQVRDDISRITPLNRLLITGTGRQAPKIEFTHAVRFDMVPGARYVEIIGSNPDIRIGPPQDVWSAGGEFTFLPSPDFINIVSDNAEDDRNGNGAFSIVLYGLNAEGFIATETLMLNGTVPVSTAIPYLHVYDIYVKSGATPTGSVGVITATGASSTLLLNQINVGDNRSFSSSAVVPINEVWYLEKVAVYGSDVTIKTCAQEVGGVTIVGDIVGLSSQGSTLSVSGFKSMDYLPPLTRFKTQAKVVVNNTPVATTTQFLSFRIQT